MAQLGSLARMVMENQAYQNGCASTEVCDAVHERFMELFNPKSLGWRTIVVQLADAVFHALVK
jgi:hypothetical protein